MRPPLTLIVLIFALPVTAQVAAAPALQFDVVSVKRHPASDGMSSGMTNTGMKCVNCSLQMIIASAYDTQPQLIIGGPAWIKSDGFDFQTKVSPEDQAAFAKLTGKQKDALLQPTLADRFGLKLHHETRLLSVYQLTVAKSGAKVQTPGPDGPKEMKGSFYSVNRGGMAFGPGEIAGNGVSTAALARILTSLLNRLVQDETGLTGVYVFDLKYNPNDSTSPNTSDPSNSEPSLFTALEEQLGLKLVTGKVPVDVLVVDGAHQPTPD